MGGPRGDRCSWWLAPTAELWLLLGDLRAACKAVYVTWLLRRLKPAQLECRESLSGLPAQVAALLWLGCWPGPLSCCRDLRPTAYSAYCSRPGSPSVPASDVEADRDSSAHSDSLCLAAAVAATVWCLFSQLLLLHESSYMSDNERVREPSALRNIVAAKLAQQQKSVSRCPSRPSAQ